MEENAPRQWHLQAPLRDEDIAQLTSGDLVYLTGPAYTARDGVYQHMLVDPVPGRIRRSSQIDQVASG